MIIPDFQNLYTNKSYLSREQQIRQFRMLVELINEQLIEPEEKQMLLNLHGLLYSVLSETPYDETVFMASDILSSQLLAVYLEQLRPGNMLVTTELVDSMDYRSDEFINMLKEYLDMLQKEIPKKFTIMIFPYRMLESNLPMWLKYIDNILAYKGRIILYDCPNRVPITDCFNLIKDCIIASELSIKMLQTKKEFEASEIDITIFKRLKKLYDDIITINDNDEVNTYKTDQLIYQAWALEKDTIKYQDDFYDKHLKYQLNEIKNALLDLRYADEADIEFFAKILMQENSSLGNLVNTLNIYDISSDIGNK